MEFLILLLIGLAIYFLPSIVASKRNAPRTGAIIALNIFLGWTLVGWVIALVWAIAETPPEVPTRRPTDEVMMVELNAKCAAVGAAWDQIVVGSPVKLIPDITADEKFCTIESEFGTVATFKDQDLVKRIAFRSDAHPSVPRRYKRRGI